MKVLKEGKWKQKWEMEVVCTEAQCGATLLVENSDVKPVDYGTGFYAKCSVCGRYITIAQDLIPMRIQQEANKKRKYRDCD